MWFCFLSFLCYSCYLYLCNFCFRFTFHFTVITKVDMRFNVRNADWLSDRVKERIMQMVSYYCYLLFYLLVLFCYTRRPLVVVTCDLFLILVNLLLPSIDSKVLLWVICTSLWCEHAPILLSFSFISCWGELLGKWFSLHLWGILGFVRTECWLSSFLDLLKQKLYLGNCNWCCRHCYTLPVFGFM